MLLQVPNPHFARVGGIHLRYPWRHPRLLVFVAVVSSVEIRSATQRVPALATPSAPSQPAGLSWLVARRCRA